MIGFFFDPIYFIFIYLKTLFWEGAHRLYHTAKGSMTHREVKNHTLKKGRK